MSRILRIGTRGSKLALIQANWVKQQIECFEPNIAAEIVIITTSGDRHQYEVVGAFTKEIQLQLLDNHIDIAVHSMKDLPTESVDGLVVTAVPKREDPRDALISTYGGLGNLPKGAVVGAGSARRAAFIKAIRPDIVTAKLTGNVDTRLRKLREVQYQAIVMAMAAQHRMGWLNEDNDTLSGLHVQPWPADVYLPAPAQAAIAIECRKDDRRTRALMKKLDDADTHYAVVAERAVLNRLGGGCSAPVGAYAEARNGELTLTAAVLNTDGSVIIKMQAHGVCANARKLGTTLANKLLKQGANIILDEVGKSNGS